MLYVNNIILFILIVHDTVYFFTSSDSKRTVKKMNTTKTVVHVSYSQSMKFKKITTQCRGMHQVHMEQTG